MLHYTYNAKPLSWNRGVPMASRRGHILLTVFCWMRVLPLRLATVSTHGLCPALIITIQENIDCMENGISCFLIGTKNDLTMPVISQITTRPLEPVRSLRWCATFPAATAAPQWARLSLCHSTAVRGRKLSTSAAVKINLLLSSAYPLADTEPRWWRCFRSPLTPPPLPVFARGKKHS